MAIFFSFPMHEHNPAVVHLAIHLENGKRVYFTDANVQQIALNPPGTSLTTFFALCQEDAFARTMMHSHVECNQKSIRKTRTRGASRQPTWHFQRKYNW